MIRRPVSQNDVTSAWLLIPQREHARLAGALVDVWDDRTFAADLAAPLRWAIYHHDDGWAMWDRQVERDIEGRPLDFRELPHTLADRIWSTSIELATSHGPLEAYLVARHFMELRLASLHRQRTANDDFVRVQEHRAPFWLQQARQEAVEPSTLTDAEVAAAALRLQHFDWLSLLLCCAPTGQREPLPIGTSAGQRVELVPGASEWEWSLDPWPLRQPSLSLSAQAREVPTRAFESSDELLAASTVRNIHWELRRLP